MSPEPMYLAQLDLDLRRIGRAFGRTDSLDPGYLLHMALDGLFGSGALKPFVAPRSGPGGDWSSPKLRVLAYTGRDANALAAESSQFAEPALHAACDWAGLATKPMPAVFSPGTRLGFRVRVAPTRRGRDERGSEIERDAFLVACSREPDAELDRVEVYLSWLREQLHGAAVEAARVEAFQLSRAYRRTQGGDRRGRVVQLPDVLVRGTLTVADADAFQAVLRRGVGRHRAFGFGMLLLERPGREG